MLSYDEFVALFRGRMLLHLSDSWAARKENIADFGRIADAHALGMKRLLREMYDSLVPKEAFLKDDQPDTIPLEKRKAT